jgi:hypothetical protein
LKITGRNATTFQNGKLLNAGRMTECLSALIGSNQTKSWPLYKGNGSVSSGRLPDVNEIKSDLAIQRWDLHKNLLQPPRMICLLSRTDCPALASQTARVVAEPNGSTTD